MICVSSETKLEPNDRKRKMMDCHNVPILSDMDLTPESIDPHKSLQLQDVHPTAAALWNIEYCVPKLVARDGSCINCEKPMLDAGEEQSVNHNRQLSVVVRVIIPVNSAFWHN